MSSEPDFLELKGMLRHWNVRRLWRDGLEWIPRGLMTGLLVAVVVATVARLRPFLHNEDVAIVTGVLALSGILGALLLLLLRPNSVGEQATFADRLFRLQERMVTAVEIHDGTISTSGSLARQQLSDTLRAARKADVSTDLPLRLIARDWIFILLAGVLLVLATTLPNPQSEILGSQEAIASSIEEQVDALETLQNEIRENPDLDTAHREELLEPIQNALESLEENPLSQEGAVATLSEAEADLRQLQQEFSTDGLRQTLKDAGQALSDNRLGHELGQALQSGDLSRAGAAVAELADSLSDLSEDELRSLAEELAETAAALEGTDAELAQQLAEAAQSLQGGDTGRAGQALRDASGTFQQRAQESTASAQAASAAGQLDQGRHEVAQAGSSSTQGQGDGTGDGAGQGDRQGQGSAPGQGPQTEQGEGTGGPGPGGGHAENVYVPEFFDFSGESGVDIELPAECIANPADCGGLLNETTTEFAEQGSSVPYADVLGDYRDAAYEALNDEYIPLGLKDYVREYFSSLEP